ncbi:hypothetical protein PAAG_03547 [Paracoccidioides lutzii Pb01]|uniref:DNA-directed RNA polymerase RBP11-like dimerisation domain-containing protein n=1 Tax=Paracoccidioides lutzii (strain ATCC MYA-826 / Pb01) TaxID=502779 RepID=C1GXH3_PARBA|nr:hypothetical protein PAAG_03547 [Paracoccidioides lutzii Pb01]EEH41261.1 hypothetical protein PAAG_03547 [Paracoccidioides lutzii Pb01]
MPASTHSQDESMPDAGLQSQGEQEREYEDPAGYDADEFEVDGRRITIVSFLVLGHRLFAAIGSVLSTVNVLCFLPGATETAVSFQFDREDHTLGNALRYVIMKNPKFLTYSSIIRSPEVEFCGYTMPHPSEAKMNLRIQTYETTTAIAVLEKGFDDLMDLCDVVTETFTEAKNAFDGSKG